MCSASLPLAKKKNGANDSTRYTLVEPRHIRVPFYTDITPTQLIGQRLISPHSGVVRPGYTLLRHSLSQIVPYCS